MLHLEPTLVAATTIATVGAVKATTRASVGIVVVLTLAVVVDAAWCTVAHSATRAAVTIACRE